jgi:hypothetical protein
VNTTKPIRHEEILTYHGTKGERATLARRMYCLFRADEISATDTGRGEVTKVGLVLVGQQSQTVDEQRFKQFSEGVISKDVSMQAFGRDHFTACQTLLPITIRVEFLEDAEITIKLSGLAVKQPGDTREMLRTRVVDAYERVRLDQEPDLANEPQFRAMIARMRTE